MATASTAAPIYSPPLVAGYTEYSVYFLHLLLGNGVIVEARNHRTYGIAQGLCIGLRNGLLRQFVYISQQRYGDCGNARKYQQHILQG
jgi:hypothetical protein